MAEDGQVTPEKQLLKLIEDTKSSKDEALKKALLKQKGSGFFSLGGLRGMFFGRLSFFKRTAKKKIGASKFSMNFAAVNRILTLAVACLLIYVAFDAIASAMSLHHPPNFAMQKDRALSTLQEGVSPLKDSAYYVQKVTSRDIFKEGPKPVEKQKNDAPPPVEMNEAMKNLSIVGISWSSSPDVIIEDKAKQRTFFVKRGQVFGEGIKVEAVFKDHVVLSFEGQEFELR